MISGKLSLLNWIMTVLSSSLGRHPHQHCTYHKRDDPTFVMSETVYTAVYNFTMCMEIFFMLNTKYLTWWVAGVAAAGPACDPRRGW